MASEPPTLGDSYVFDYNAEGRKIYVPYGTYDLYLENELWSEYANSIEGI